MNVVLPTAPVHGSLPRFRTRQVPQLRAGKFIVRMLVRPAQRECLLDGSVPINDSEESCRPLRLERGQGVGRGHQLERARDGLIPNPHRPALQSVRKMQIAVLMHQVHPVILVRVDCNGQQTRPEVRRGVHRHVALKSRGARVVTYADDQGQRGITIGRTAKYDVAGLQLKRRGYQWRSSRTVAASSREKDGGQSGARSQCSQHHFTVRGPQW